MFICLHAPERKPIWINFNHIVSLLVDSNETHVWTTANVYHTVQESPAQIEHLILEKKQMARYQVTRTAQLSQTLFIMAGSPEEAQERANDYGDDYWAANNQPTEYSFTVVDTNPATDADE